MNDEKKKYTFESVIVGCTCSNLGHAVRFSRNEDGEILAEVSLSHERDLWKRARTAWRYLLNDVCGYGDMAEVYLAPEDLKKIQGWAE
jgi:hypothetical protein